MHSPAVITGSEIASLVPDPGAGLSHPPGPSLPVGDLSMPGGFVYPVQDPAVDGGVIDRYTTL